MDRRLAPGNARAALQSLQGQVEAERFVPGEPAQVVVPLADLLARPFGPRDRQLLLGDSVVVIDRDEGHAFVQARKDGYCGYLALAEVGIAPIATHVVGVPATHAYPEPKVQARETERLSFGARVAVAVPGEKFTFTNRGYIPTPHLRPLAEPFSDPVAVAMLFLGTPYLWGGNSRDGLDCSGLVQAALLACGKACPGDSDLQQVLGTELPEDAGLERGDLLFWRGHVAIAVDAETLIHANGHAMAVALEPVADTIRRIAEQGGGPVTARRRP